jgi:hypothetical protein
MTKSQQPRKATKPKQPEANPASGTDTTRDAPLNFKVSAEFRREFKTYAAQHNKKLNQLLYEAFAALKAEHAD